MAAELTPAARLAELREISPRVARVAELLALAARIEPELLRDVRLELFPGADASLEAEFYFSALVAERTPQWVVLDAELAQEMRRKLASAIKRKPRERATIERARELIERAHASIPFEIAREEEIVWLDVQRPLGKKAAVQAIDEILRDLVVRASSAREQAGFVARWFASAWKRLPPLARETDAFTQLAFASSIVLGGRRVVEDISPTAETFHELVRYVPRSAKRTPLWGALTTHGLSVVSRESDGYQSFEAPLSNPILLEVRAEGGKPRLATLVPGQPLFVALPNSEVFVRTIGGDLLTFRPRPRAETVRAGDFPSRGTEGTAILHDVPELPPHYVERPELLRQVHASMMEPGRPTAIVGAAGMGKTLLAAAYARSAAAMESFPNGIFWLTRGQREKVEAAVTPGVPGKLLIFDDIGSEHWRDMAAVFQTYGKENPLLFTTRDSRLAEASTARQVVVQGLSSEEALATLADAVGQSHYRLPEAAHRLATLLEDAPLMLSEAVARARAGIPWEQILDEFESKSPVSVEPLGVAIVIERKHPLRLTINLDCTLQNKRFRPQQVSRMEGVLTAPAGTAARLQWNVFYTTTGSEQSRIRDAGSMEVAPGETRMGIQFVSRPNAESFPWTAGSYVLEVSVALAGKPGLSGRWVLSVTHGDVESVHRWRRASGEQWASVSDEAVGIPVSISPPVEPHPWEAKISPEKFIEAYTRHRSLSPKARSELHALIERLNQDRGITDVRIAAYILAAVASETGGGFGPTEQLKVPEYSEAINRSLGNVNEDDRETYRGRGYVLVEGRGNYRRLSESLHLGKDLVRDPELLLEPNVAYQALRFLLIEGGLTGRRLSEFINADKTDYFEARRVGFGSSGLAERVAKEAQELEGLLRESLAPR